MGWYYSHGVNRKQLIESRVANWENGNDDMVVKSVCLKHCYRGGVFSGVLWSVWEHTFTKDGVEVKPSQRFIQCDLLQCYNKEWGYKPLCESMHPYYYSCPLSYLDLVPIGRYGGNSKWREGVVEYHQSRKNKKQKTETKLFS